LEYTEKEVEVIAFETSTPEPAICEEKTHEEKIKKAFAVFYQYRVSIEGYKFDRDEANER